ncbi:MAG: PA2169 family four-helix-bundle protein [Blastochloris sp.]|nr:PA2169 family four-helix-bundle protein [Blastochloris sp.]
MPAYIDGLECSEVIRQQLITSPDEKPAIIATLNRLVRVCMDAYEGYRRAAEESRTPSLALLFEEYAIERKQFANDLGNIIIILGGEALDGHMNSGAYQRWLNLRRAIGRDDSELILGICERSEAQAAAAYREALERIRLPSNVARLVQEQHMQIARTHRMLQQLHLQYRLWN